MITEAEQSCDHDYTFEQDSPDYSSLPPSIIFDIIAGSNSDDTACDHHVKMLEEENESDSRQITARSDYEQEDNTLKQLWFHVSSSSLSSSPPPTDLRCDDSSFPVVNTVNNAILEPVKRPVVKTTTSEDGCAKNAVHVKVKPLQNTIANATPLKQEIKPEEPPLPLAAQHSMSRISHECKGLSSNKSGQEEIKRGNEFFLVFLIPEAEYLVLTAHHNKGVLLSYTVFYRSKKSDKEPWIPLGESLPEQSSLTLDVPQAARGGELILVSSLNTVGCKKGEYPLITLDYEILAMGKNTADPKKLAQLEQSHAAANNTFKSLKWAATSSSPSFVEWYEASKLLCEQLAAELSALMPHILSRSTFRGKYLLVSKTEQQREEDAARKRERKLEAQKNKHESTDTDAVLVDNKKRKATEAVTTTKTEVQAKRQRRR